MWLYLHEKYIFIEAFSMEIPDLTIITGLNGSGKTVLLQGIYSSIIKNDISNQASSTQFLNNQSFQLQNPQLSKTADTPNFDLLHQEYVDYRINIQNELIEKNQHLESVLETMANFAQKDKFDLTFEDFEKYAPFNFSFHGGGVYNLNFFRICMLYAQLANNNSYKEFLHTKKNKTDIEYLTQEEFLKVHGEAPWDYINKIFDSMNIDYQISTTEITDYDDAFNVHFINKITGVKVDFSSLSSGEQVIILTALSIYNIKDYDILTPKIILMDEPDASLHPSMIKYFLKVVEDIFVKERGIKVIITTHNPTTVALAPEESIFTMSMTNGLKKTEKDSALKILSEGVPSFSVNYENRRQVFVESPYDVQYYERLYNILSNRLNNEISLNFIASGDVQKNSVGLAKNSCDIVKEITEIMRNAGNKFIYGIIDWDRNTQKPTNPYVSVLGWEQRYSIENYIFDPLLIAAILLREKYITKDELGIDKDDNYTDLKNYDATRLQSIADYILTKLKPHLTDPVALQLTENTEVTLLNNIKINLPNWFLHHQGHELEDAYIKAFDDLKKIKKQKEELLKLEIINKVIDDIPEIISSDLLKIIQDVQA